MPHRDIRIKRVYETPDEADGTRILVDRLWPRGLKKETARVDEWLKEIAPSAELRKWYGHDRARWPEFKARYARELDDKTELLDRLRRQAAQGRVTLVFASREERYCNAEALKEILEGTG